MQVKETVYKIAIAAYLHDIGKFAERAKIKSTSKDSLNLKPGFYIDDNFRSQFKNRYLPYYNRRYTHNHAIFTAAFIDHIEKCFPKEFNYENWGLGDSFTDLAASHHKPETPFQWIIAIADRVSSAFEREEFEDYNKQIDVKDYRLTRLIPILENISLDKNPLKKSLEEFYYFYPLKEINANSIFAIPKEEKDKYEKDSLEKEYQELFFQFINSLDKLEDKDNIPIWFDHFDSLFMIFASNIPAATVGKQLPDNSLYDHSKMTSALATALYLYHYANNSLEIDKIRNYEEKKFLIICGDFFGIQNFIFSEGSNISYGAAKLLRGRSFQISLITELIAYIISEELILTPASIIFNAAGQFTIIAPNLKEYIEKIKKIEEIINDWFYKMFICESSFGIIYHEASCNDLIKEDSYKLLWKEIDIKIQAKKFNKIDIDKYGGVFEGYLDSFNNTLDKKICPFCGKKPSSPECEGEKILGDVISSCKICRDQIFIGKNIVKAKRIAIVDSQAEIKQDNKLLEPLLGKYQLIFLTKDREAEEIKQFKKNLQLIKYWDISLPLQKDEQISKSIAAKWINSYVPHYTDADLEGYLFDTEFINANQELLEAINNQEIKPFNHIALASIKQENGSYYGTDALGILQADIDSLGKIFSEGMKKPNLSKRASLSRQLNSFFTIYIPYLLSTENKYKNLYTIFSGGDDLFLIGPWNTVIDFAEFIKEKFDLFVCNNPDITFSMGITISKGNEPVSSLARRSKIALQQSKSEKGKSSLTLFNETVKWQEYPKLKALKEKLEEWLNNGYLNKAMIFRFNNFMRDAQIEKEIIERKNKIIALSDLEALKWRSLFKYTIARNVAKELKEAQRQKKLEEMEKISIWLIEYGTKFKIPLWQIIYENRKIGR